MKRGEFARSALLVGWVATSAGFACGDPERSETRPEAQSAARAREFDQASAWARVRPDAPLVSVDPALEASMPPTSAVTRTIRPGDTLELAASVLPKRGKLGFALLVPFELTPGTALPTRVLAEDRRSAYAQAVASAEHVGRVDLELEAEFLEPDRYVIELKTPERSHFPLRRYALRITEGS